jgi:hypothetical protein
VLKYGTTSTQNFNRFLKAIPELQNSYQCMTRDRAGVRYVRLCYVKLGYVRLVLRMCTSSLLVASCFHIAHLSKYFVSTAKCEILSIILHFLTKIQRPY